MMIALLLRLVLHASLAAPVGSTPPIAQQSVDVQSSPRAAQVKLAETLGSADSIDGVSVRGHAITFAVTRGDAPLTVTATTRGARGDVVSVEVTEAAIATEVGDISWLAAELAEATAVTRLAVDEDGALTVITNGGRRYMIIPGRGSGGAAGNEAVESRWAAEWNR